MIRESVAEEMVPAGIEPPKRADFVHWSEYLANALAPGASAARMRSYLKMTAKECWEFTNWLTHARNATRLDGDFATDATFHVLGVFGIAIVRARQSAPERCADCGSYRVTNVHRPDIDAARPYCAGCGTWGKD